MSRLGEIRGSFCRLPLWVRLWLALILVPVNMASLLFLAIPGGMTLAVLANGALLINLALMLEQRGLSKAMALPHLVFWTPMLAWIIWLQQALPDMPDGFALYLWGLLAVDAVSLGFDLVDGWKWLRGDRAVA